MTGLFKRVWQMENLDPEKQGTCPRSGPLLICAAPLWELQDHISLAGGEITNRYPLWAEELSKGCFSSVGMQSRARARFWIST